MFDLIVRGGRLVLPYKGEVDADIGVVGEKIAQIGGSLGSGREELDATGKLVFPGCVDTHTHYGHFNEFFAEMATESRGLLALGITTSMVLIDRSVRNMARWIALREDPSLFAQPDTDDVGLAHQIWRSSYHQVVPLAIEDAEQVSANDFGFHLGMANLDQVSEIPAYQTEYGITSFKCWPGLYPWACPHRDRLEGIPRNVP